MSHGQRRVKTSEQLAAEKAVEATKRFDELKAITERVTAMRAANELTPAALEATAQLLTRNSEFYSIWNYRRAILEAAIAADAQYDAATMAWEAERTREADEKAAAAAARAAESLPVDAVILVPGTPEAEAAEAAEAAAAAAVEATRPAYPLPSALADVVRQEFRFSEGSIAKAPKSYWAWHHRKVLIEWVVLGRIPGLAKPDWTRELELCSQLLHLDSRNFHCWTYRRFVVALARTPLQAELDFTTKLIERSFSNYSAWHQRSALLSEMYRDDPVGMAAAIRREFDMVHNAIFTEPKDQSAWIYFQWLIGRDTPSRQLLEDELALIQELQATDPDSKWVLFTMLLVKARLAHPEPELLELLRRLKQVDPHRANSYQEQLGSILAKQRAGATAATE